MNAALRRRILVQRGLLKGHRGVAIHPRVTLGGPGRYELAPGSYVHRDASVWVGPGAHLQLAPGAAIGIRANVNVESGLSIGPCTAMSWDVQIMDTDFHDIVRPTGTAVRSAPIVIGAHVLVGARAMILKGVTVGDGAIIAASAVVSRDVEAGAIVAGNPARVVGHAVDWT